MKKTPVADAPTGSIVDLPFAEALGQRYLSYALSTIMSRSLPDVRDGLKPVHRRLLYAMSQLKLISTQPPKKSARIVGDVMGKYHPHGDAAIYEAMVRVAQDFSVRYQLVDGQGNFGNIDGDGAAAMRYTEARLTAVAEALLAGIDNDAVDFRGTYDGEGAEPTVMPARFPHLLANGATGIAVGMATSIPPHNVGEICDAARHLIKHPNASIETLVGFMPGPDFPTGGILVESRESVISAYRTGRGSFRLRARWEVEKLKNGTWQVVVTQIPYQVPKSRLIEKTAEALMAKKLPFLDDIRDESADDVRVVLVPKSRTIEPAMLMESLFRATELETKFPLNMNVLDRHGVPQVMDLRVVLQAFLDHRLDVLERTSRHRLQEIDHRLEVLGGYLIAYLNLDEVIHIIRTEDEPKPVLMKRFGLTDTQAEAILNMRLRSLRKLEEFEIKKEHDGLSAEKENLQKLLADEALRWAAIDRELKDIQKQFGKDTPDGKRRTDIADAPEPMDIPLDAMIEKENITITLSEKDWVRAVKGHGLAADDIKYKEGDTGRFVFEAETTDKLLVFASNGKCFTIDADKLPKGRGFGEPLRLLVGLENDASVLTIFRLQKGIKYLVASSSGRGFLVQDTDLLAQTKSGKQVLNLEDGETAAVCIPAVGDHVAIIGTNRKLLIFPVDQIPEMGRGKGVILQRYKDGHLSDIKVFAKDAGLTWSLGQKTRTETDIKGWIGTRANTGFLPPNGFPKNNRFS
jgi:topoisomerase IV subunit A